MALEVTYRECLQSIQGGKESPGLSHLCAEYDASEGTRAHDKLGGEACGVEHPLHSRRRKHRQVHHRSKAARKEGVSSASYVNTSVPIETARNS